MLCPLSSAGDASGGSSSHTLLQVSSNPVSNLCFALVGAKSNSAVGGPAWNGNVTSTTGSTGNGAHGVAQASDSVSQGMCTSWCSCVYNLGLPEMAVPSAPLAVMVMALTAAVKVYAEAGLNVLAYIDAAHMRKQLSTRDNARLSDGAMCTHVCVIQSSSALSR